MTIEPRPGRSTSNFKHQVRTALIFRHDLVDRTTISQYDDSQKPLHSAAKAHVLPAAEASLLFGSASRILTARWPLPCERPRLFGCQGQRMLDVTGLLASSKLRSGAAIVEKSGRKREI